MLAVLERTQPGSSSRTLTPPWDGDGSSAISIERQVSNSRKTLKELEKLLADLRSGNGSRVSRHLKLQDRGKQIDGLSARIKTHTDALQMSLQIVAIKISLAIPDFLLRQLDEALQDISTRLAKMEDGKRRLLDRNGLEEDNEDPLIELAQDALRRGTILYQDSVAGSSIDVESAMGSEKVVFVEDWIHGLGHQANAHAPQDGPLCLVPVSFMRR